MFRRFSLFGNDTTEPSPALIDLASLGAADADGDNGLIADLGDTLDQTLSTTGGAVDGLLDEAGEQLGIVGLSDGLGDTVDTAASELGETLSETTVALDETLGGERSLLDGVGDTVEDVTDGLGDTVNDTFDDAGETLGLNPLLADTGDTVDCLLTNAGEDLDSIFDALDAELGLDAQGLCEELGIAVEDLQEDAQGTLLAVSADLGLSVEELTVDYVLHAENGEVQAEVDPQICVDAELVLDADLSIPLIDVDTDAFAQLQLGCCEAEEDEADTTMDLA